MNDENNLVEMTIEIVASYVSHNNLRPEDVPAFIASTHAAVAGLSGATASGDETETTAAEPAVSVRKSLASRDHIISMIDGKPYRSLKRHLSSRGMTPDQYRERYGLKADYPMVAPGYSEARREVAKKLGLGRRPRNAGGEDGGASAAASNDAKPARRGRKPAQG